MSLFKAFGFSIRVLHKEDTDEIFRVFKPVLVRNHFDQLVVNRDIRILQGEIRYALKNKKHVIIGLEKDGVLVGAAMCNDDSDIPWIGHLNILKEYRGTKAVVVLMHFILNILFKDKNVSVAKANVKQFKKHLMPDTSLLKIRLFHPKSKERFQIIIDRDKK